MLESAQGPESITQFDFVGIYNIAKHITYLKESSSAVYSTANRIADQHYELLAHPQRAHTSELMRGVQSLLQHKLSLLEGCTLRVQSLESRAQNVTNLVSPRLAFPQESSSLKQSAGFQHRQPTRQPQPEIRQPIYERHRHDDHAFPSRGHCGGMFLTSFPPFFKLLLRLPLAI